LQYLLNLREGKGQGKREWIVRYSSHLVTCMGSLSADVCGAAQNTLQSEGFDDDAGLDETIKKLEGDLKKARKKEADGDDSVVGVLFCFVVCLFSVLIGCGDDDRRSRRSLWWMFLMRMYVLFRFNHRCACR